MLVVIFDMDGTLINSGHDITISVNYVRKTVYGLEPLSTEFVVDAINRDNRNLALEFYRVPVYEPEAQSVFEAHYHDQCVQSPQLYDGIEMLLSDLFERGALLYVATNAPAQFAQRMLDHLNVASYFNRIVGSEHVQQSKPHPDMLNLILDECGFTSTKDFALMVGDNGKDMEAARRAGIAGAFVTWGFSSMGIGEIVCSTPVELLQVIETGESGKLVSNDFFP